MHNSILGVQLRIARRLSIYHIEIIESVIKIWNSILKSGIREAP